jgi:uncharacterized membrane protein YozB (DUF420 family)
MAPDFPANAALLRQITELFKDMSDLVASEIALARAEASNALSSAFNAGILFAATAVVALLAGVMLLGAIVFFIASFGLAMHWAFLVVAAILAVVSMVLFITARGKIQHGIAPERSVRQFHQTVQSAKELVQ